MRFILIGIFIFQFLLGHSQDIVHSRTGSHFTFIYKITNQEAGRILQNSSAEIGESFFHTLIDFYPSDSIYQKKLPTGHYLFIKSDQEHLEIEMESVNNILIGILTNKRDLIFILMDKDGNELKGEHPFIKNHQVLFNEKYQAYRQAKTNRQGWIKVEREGHLNFFEIARKYNNTFPQQVQRRVLGTFPINHLAGIIMYVSRSVKSMIQYGYMQPPTFYYRMKKIFDEKTFGGYMVLNKPKYKPGDTVRIKAFVVNKKGKAINKPLDVYIYGYGATKSIRKKMGKANTYAKGAYAFEFVLHDSLKLTLDKQVSIYLEDKRGNNYPDQQFNYEQYELKQNNYTLSQDKSKKKDSPITLTLKGTDSNDLPLYDIRAEVIVLSKSVNTFYDKITFIPDTLWVKNLKLDPLGDTRIDIPDSVFANANLHCEVSVAFTNADNERQVKTINMDYDRQTTAINVKVENDSLQLSSKLPVGTYILHGFNSEQEKTIDRSIALPHHEKINPSTSYFELIQNNKVIKTIDLNSITDQVDVMSERNKDSLIVVIRNPRKLLLRYQLFKGNKIIETGNGQTYQTKRKADPTKNYYLSIQYLWAGKPRYQNYDLPFVKKQLAISIDHPYTVFPGQTVDFSIDVKDAFGKPVDQVDLTAYSITKKFGSVQTPTPPQFERFKSRKAFNEFHEKETDQKKVTQVLKYHFWKNRLGLDSIDFYHFLYPNKGVFTQHVPAEDSITQIAPYVVKDGTIQPVYYLYINNELKYYYGSEGVEPYSFRCNDNDTLTIQLRLADTLLTVRKFKPAKGMKSIISLDKSNLPFNTTAESRSNSFTNEEANRLRSHFIWVNRDYTQRKAYLQQGHFYHLLNSVPSHGYRNMEMVGPFVPGVMKYKSGFELVFNLKPERSYTFYPDMIDRETIDKEFRFPLPFRKASASFNDQVLTEKSIQTYWHNQDMVSGYTFKAYPDNHIISNKKGSLSIKDKTNANQRLATFILNLNLPDEYYIYPGTHSTFNELIPGLYQLVIIYSDKRYVRPQPILVQEHGRTFINLEDEAVHQEDEFSEKVISKIQSWVQQSNYITLERQKDMQDIRQYYYTQSTNYTEYAEGKWYSGKITSSEDGSAIPGVNVILKGTANGTTTDMSGEYRIYGPPNAVLVFSFIGFITEEFKTSDHSRIDFQLSNDVKQLNEVVVVGYAVQSKRELTGAVSSVTSLLQGRVAGVQISGTPGARDSIAIRIRGALTMAQNENPLVVVDGVITPMNDVDKSRIASIEVLRSEQAIALYGSRGSNGVILISTKPGVTKNQLLQTLLPDAPLASSIDYTPGSSLRKNFRDYAFWQPKLKTDKEGKAHFKATFPDDITGWNIHVLGMASGKKSGETKSKIQSFKPLVAQLSIPSFLIQGDSLLAIGKITNYTSDTIHARKTFSINNKTKKTETVLIKTSVIDSLIVTATNPDTLLMKYETDYGNYLDGEERKITVLRKGIKEAHGVFVALPVDSVFNLHFNSGNEKIKIYAQTDLLDVLTNEIQGVKSYPYECNEQLASKLKVLLAEKSICEFRKKKFEHDQWIEKIIKRLLANQNKDGGWSWWGSGKSTAWITRHVAQALDLANKSKYKAIYDRSGVKKLLIGSDERRSSPEEQLKTFLFLVQSGEQVMAKELIDTLAAKNQLYSNYYKLLAQQLLQKSGRNPDWKWIEKQKHQTLKSNWYWGEEKKSLWNNSIENTLLVYQLMEHQNPNNPDLFHLRNYFIEKRNHFWSNTYESSRIIEVILPGMLKNNQHLQPPSLQISGDTTFMINQFPYEISLSKIQSVTVTKKGNEPVYFTAYQESWNENPEEVTKDFSIQTQWQSNKTKLKAGKPIALEITLEVKKEAEYVMISVPIPAGCTYDTKDQSWSNGEVYREYDRHETRIYCEKLKEGKYTYSIQLQPRYKGHYQINPAKAEWMYFPVVYGREATKRISIE